MNEQHFALQVRRVLDDSAERLPYRVSHRLEAARRAALARMPRERTAPVGAGHPAQVPIAPVGGAASAARAGGTPAAMPGSIVDAGTAIALSPSLAPAAAVARTTRPLWLRVAVVLVPLLLVAIGLIEIAAWHELDVADETAEVDLAVLTDDIPISAYADRGFGVFLKNSQQ